MTPDRSDITLFHELRRLADQLGAGVECAMQRRDANELGLALLKAEIACQQAMIQLQEEGSIR